MSQTDYRTCNVYDSNSYKRARLADFFESSKKFEMNCFGKIFRPQPTSELIAKCIAIYWPTDQLFYEG